MRQAKGSINGLGKRAVGQNIVRVGDIGRTAFEIESQTDTLILFTLAHFQCLPMILLYNRVLRPGKRSRRFAIPLEIEGFSKILVLGVGQLIGESATFVRAFFQHFPNERLRVDHVLQTHGSHCVVEDAIISQEFVDGLNVADVLAIIFGLTFDHRVRGDRLQRAFHIGSDQLNLAQCIDHGSIPIAGPWRAGFRGTLTRKPYARLTTGDDFQKAFARQLQASLGR